MVAACTDRQLRPLSRGGFQLHQPWRLQLRRRRLRRRQHARPASSTGGGGTVCCMAVPRDKKTWHLQITYDLTPDEDAKNMSPEIYETDIAVPQLPSKRDGYIELHFSARPQDRSPVGRVSDAAAHASHRLVGRDNHAEWDRRRSFAQRMTDTDRLSDIARLFNAHADSSDAFGIHKMYCEGMGRDTAARATERHRKSHPAAPAENTNPPGAHATGCPPRSTPRQLYPRIATAATSGRSSVPPTSDVVGSSIAA